MLSPRPSRFSDATLKSWEWPGDKAIELDMSLVHVILSHLYGTYYYDSIAIDLCRLVSVAYHPSNTHCQLEAEGHHAVYKGLHWLGSVARWDGGGMYC